MADGGIDLREISYSQLFPWIRLFRNFGIAVDGKKMLLAAFGLVLMWVGWEGLDLLFPGSPEITPDLAPQVPVIHRLVGIEPLATAVEAVSDPIRTPASPFLTLFEIGGGSLRFVHGLLATLWMLLVWSLIGAAIARIALVEGVAGTSLSLVAALRFAVRKTVALIGAPLTPIIGATFITALCAGMGLLYRIPGTIGPAGAGVFAFLPLLAGLVLSMILAGLVAGWPLMVASVAAEDEDAFDALSRAYGYVFQRPGHLAAYVALAWGLGVIGLLVVSAFARAVVHLAAWSLAFGGPDDQIAGYFAATGVTDTVPAAIHAWWISLVVLLTFGWVYSYFWSSTATIYLLLRHDVDGADPGQIRLPQPIRDPLAREPVDSASAAPAQDVAAMDAVHTEQITPPPSAP
jgi:hypothetical protein